jgi:hypothetical protein
MFLSSSGINKKFAIRKRRIGNRNVINDPSSTANPKSQISMAKYIGFRLIRKGPDVVRADGPPWSWKLVPTFRNAIAAQLARTRPMIISDIPRYVYGLGTMIINGNKQ